MSAYPPSPGPEDQATLGRARLVEALLGTGAEDPAAFRELYRLTSAKLFGICLRICGTREEAEEVLQEVYATVWRRAGAFEPGRASPITWLSTIARNRAIDRRRARGPVAAGGIDEAAALPDPGVGALDALLRDERERALHRCLDALDGKQRNAIRAAFFGGHSYAELADMGGVPAGTVKSWIRRGLKRLRDCLDGD